MLTQLQKNTLDKSAAPQWLDEAGRAKWAEVLGWAHWLTRADGDMLALYCDSWSHYLIARKLAVLYPDGPVLNPAVECLSEAFEQLRSAGAALGISGRNVGPGAEGGDAA